MNDLTRTVCTICWWGSLVALVAIAVAAAGGMALAVADIARIIIAF